MDCTNARRWNITRTDNVSSTLSINVRTEGIGEPSGQSILNIIRAKWTTNAAHGLRIIASDRTAAQKYRCRSATVWKDAGGIDKLKRV